MGSTSKLNPIGLCVILFTGLLLTSCGGAQYKIGKYIYSQPGHKLPDSSVIDLSEILKCDYDTAYVFYEFEQMSFIAHALGMADYYNRRVIMDSHKRLILIKNGAIVYEDDVENDPFYFNIGKDFSVIGKEEGFGNVNYGKFTTKKFLTRKTGDAQSLFSSTSLWEIFIGNYELIPVNL